MEYLDGCDAAVNEGEGAESLEAVDDLHVAEVLEYQLDTLDLVHLLPHVVLEPVHPFLSHPRLTTMSSSAESDFLAPCFASFSYLPYII